MSRIPRDIVEQHKQGVESLTFYGYAATDLGRDELLAMVNCLAQSLKEQRERTLANLEMFRALRDA